MKFETCAELLGYCANVIDSGLDSAKTCDLFKVLGLPEVPADYFYAGKLLCESAPKIKEFPYNEKKRCLHMLWEAFNYSPYQVNLKFSVPFRRLIAKKLFKKCGEGFTALSMVTFYFPENISVGDNVLFHNHTFIDAGGGVTFCDGSTLAENSKIYTHEHDEGDMNIEIHKPVYIGKNAFVLAGSTVLYGVTIGEGAIVGGGSMVRHDVPANTVVVGTPAKPVRERRAKLQDDYVRDNFQDIKD